MLLSFTACSSGDGSNTTKVPTKTEKKAAAELLDRATIQEVIAKSTKIELLFYLGEGSMSTALPNRQQIDNFNAFITDAPFTPTKECKPNGSALFMDDDGNILIDSELNFLPECNFIRMVYNKKTYYHKLSPQANPFFMQFVKLMQQGQQ